MAINKSTIRNIVEDVLFDVADATLSDIECNDIAEEVAQRLADETDDVTDDDDEDAEYDDQGTDEADQD